MHAPRVLSVVIGIFQNPLRRHQVGRPEAFSKPTVNGFEAGDRVGPLALLTQKAGKARRRAQFPGQSLLAARLIKRLPAEALRCFCGCGMFGRLRRLSPERARARRPGRAFLPQASKRCA
jgi:hypothetical protein